MNIDFNNINFFGFLTILVIAFIILVIAGGILLVVRGLSKGLKRIKTPLFEIEKSDDKKEFIESELPVIEKEEREKNFCIKKSLTKHSFFETMQYYIDIVIPQLEISHELKKIVVIEFLLIKFSVFKTLLFDYVANQEQILLSGGTVSTDDINEIFLSGIKEYNNTARQKEIKYQNKIIKIPEVFINKFDKWHSPHVDLTFQSIKEISMNDIYPNEMMKLLAIIEMFMVAFKLTILDALASISELNGQLEKELNIQIER
ncbi:MAG TPA: hypothetical protein PK771_15075 [Spirochaetota bacterium]|nr:hypothetical protein [Spirochaetota bacterium]